MVLNKLFFFSAILSFFSLHAQKEMNHLFIEAGGPAEYGSFNYERIIVQKANFTFANRIGLSMNNFKDYNGNFNPTILIPLNITFIKIYAIPSVITSIMIFIILNFIKWENL